MRVSIRELKNHLSKYLQMTTSGEPVIITSHNKPVAKIMPIPQSENEQMQKLMRIDGVIWTNKKPHGGKTRPVIQDKTVSDYVLEERE
jgi:prevent-host-death family protein